MAQGYIKAADLPQVIPVFPLPGAILLPRGQLPLNIFEPRYLNMIDDAMAGDRIIGMIQPRAGRSEPAGSVADRLRRADHQFRRDLGRALSDHPDRLRPFPPDQRTVEPDALSPDPRRFRAVRGRSERATGR